MTRRSVKVFMRRLAVTGWNHYAGCSERDFQEAIHPSFNMNVIQTERLSLRQLELHDAEFILELLNEAQFLRFIGDKGVRNLADARAYILKGPMDSYQQHGFGLYAACLLDGAPTGICGLVKRDGLEDVDVGFAFLARHCAQGYAVESASAVLAQSPDPAAGAAAVVIPGGGLSLGSFSDGTVGSAASPWEKNWSR